MFKKGVVTNPNGRPKGSQNVITTKIFNELLKEMKNVQNDVKVSGGKSLLRHFIERAYKNDVVLTAVMKKLVADRSFNIEDLQNANVRVTFEIVEPSKKEEENGNVISGDDSEDNSTTD